MSRRGPLGRCQRCRKNAWRSPAAARKAAARDREAFQERLYVYPCRYGNGWHLITMPPATWPQRTAA